MTDTSSHLPVCVYCGTPRPADETSCPNCGKGWIDVRIDDDAAAPAHAPPPPPPSGAEPAPSADAAPEQTAPSDPDPETSTAEIPAAGGAAVAAGAAAVGVAAATSPPTSPPGGGVASAIDDTGEFSFDDWTMPPDKPRSMARWLIPLILLIAVVVVWVLVFVDRSSTPTTTVAAATTTTAATEATSTTVVETTTTAAPTTTVVDFPPPSAWEPVGDPIPTDALSLRAAGIGPLDIGSPIADVAGRLTASLGEATSATVDGLCPPEESYALQWSELTALFDGFGDDAVFVSYRYGGPDTPQTLGLTTLSGLALGDTVADLQRIYAQFTIAFEIIDGIDYFRLVDGAELLLWGPVTGTESDDLVEGIYSPSACTDG